LTLAAVVVVSVGGVGVGVSSGASGLRRGEPRASARSRPAGVESGLSGALSAREKAKRRWLSSPAAVAQRLASSMEFHGLKPAAATRLLARDYGAVLREVSENPAATLASQGHVLQYLSNYEAVIATPGGRRREISSAPLRVPTGGGGLGPVDLALVSREGGFGAVRPLVPFSISGDVAGGVALGGSGLRISMVGLNRPGELVDRRDVFFAGVAPDTDAVVAPKLRGVDLLAVLRSSLSPSDLRYRVSLPPGATLQPIEGAVAVVEGGRVVAEVRALEARDAQGAVVPVSMRVSGGELLVEVLRRSDVDYPLLVDPEVVDITESSEHWSMSSSTSRFCGSDAPYKWTSPAKGTPIAISLSRTEFPLASAEHCSEESRLRELAVAGWRWRAPASFGVAEFYGVSLSGHAVALPGEAEAPKDLAWGLGSGCYLGSGHRQYGYLSSPPSLVVLVGGTAECAEGEVELFLEAGEIKPESGAAKVEGALSVESVLLTEYEVHPERLSEWLGTENAGEPDRQHCHQSDPVECVNGNKVESQTDLDIAGRGPALQVTRTYNSQQATAKSESWPAPFGVGWSFAYSAHLTRGEVCEESVCTGRKTIRVVQGNGSSVEFVHESGAWTPVSPLAQATLSEEGEDYVYTLPSQVVQRFSKSSLRLESETDRDGNALTMKYVEGHPTRLETVTGQAGRKLTFTYNAEGLIESVTNPMGHTAQYAYESENLVSVTEPGESSPRWQFKYNPEHEMISMTDGRGDVVTTEYNTSHEVTKQVEFGKEWKWEYTGTLGKEATKTTISEPNGSKTREEFNVEGEPTAVTRAYGTGSAATTKYKYNGSSELTEVTDPNEHSTKYTYDGSGNRTSEDSPDGDETKWEYDSKHDIVKITRPNGEVTTIKRTGDGDPEVVERPAPGSTTQKTTYKYDAHGDIESISEPLSHEWKYEYDSYGDRKAEIDPEGNKRTFVFNENSQLISSVSPRGNVGGGEPEAFTTTIERDAQGRPLVVSEPEAGPSKPVNKAPSSIAGTAQEGQTLTAEPGIWEGSPAPTYSYQWQVCNPLGESCYTVPGATGSTTPLNSETLGYSLRVIVTATNSAGSASSTSAPTAVVSSGAPPVYFSSFGSAGTSNGQFERPTSLAIDASGNIWVVDSYNNRIEKFSSSGTWLATYGKYGTEHGEYKEPDGIAINHSTGNVYITDQNNNRVQELNEKGEFVRAFGTPGTENGKFDEPAGIAIDTKGNVWVTDYGNDRVQEFNEKGEYLSKFGSSGTEDGHFNGPSGVVYSSGVLYVTDLNNDRFQVLTEAGEYLGLVGGSGVEAGRFSLPAGISANSSGDVYIADLGNDRIQEFGEYGNFLAMFGAAGSGAGELSEPEGLDAGSSGEIYVADSGNNRVEKWLPAGKPANTTPPSISGDVSLGQTLTAGPGVWAAAPVPTYTYQWQRCNTAGAECANISGATSQTHTVAHADIASTLRVEVTASNTGGSTEASSAATEPVTHPRVTVYTYDGNGNPKTVTGPNDHTTTYTYNAANEPTKVEEPDGAATETEYDATGQITAQTNGDKQTTKYVRNALEQVAEVIEPGSRKTLEEYDAAGNLKKLTDPAKRTTTYTYDAANNLTEVSYSSGKPSTIKYEYNKDGDRTKITDGTGTTIYKYDELDRLTEAENGHKEVSKYEYNLANGPTKITYPNGKAVTRSYDKDDRLASVTDWLEHTTKFSYDEDSNLKATIFPTSTGDEDKYTYNNSDEMHEAKMTKGSETLASLAYNRNPEGSITNTLSKGLPGEEAIESTYDNSKRLTKAASTSYEYDAANNPTKIGAGTYKYNENDELETGPSIKYTYNELGQRTQTKPTTGPATNYTYDQAGNLTAVERPKEGETTKIEDTYTYNAENLRTSEDISGTTNYLDWDPAEELPILLSNGTNSYIYGASNTPVEQINNTTGKAQYLHHDQAGSTRLITGSTGTVEGKCSYSAYGTPTCEGTATTPLGYDGQYTSPDTGLIYMRNRVYDPSTAQFLTVDPLVGITGEPYNYAFDDPLNLVDPSGLEAIPLPIAGPQDLSGCADPVTIALCGAGGVYAAKELYNAFAGEAEPDNDEGEALVKKQAEEVEQQCGEIPRDAIDAKAALRKIARETGIPEGELSDALHESKEFGEVGPSENTKIDPKTGDIYDEKTGEQIGNVFR
jgi:RHS repeat-associated protein